MAIIISDSVSALYLLNLRCLNVCSVTLGGGRWADCLDCPACKACKSCNVAAGSTAVLPAIVLPTYLRAHSKINTVARGPLFAICSIAICS